MQTNVANDLIVYLVSDWAVAVAVAERTMFAATSERLDGALRSSDSDVSQLECH